MCARVYYRLGFARAAANSSQHGGSLTPDQPLLASDGQYSRSGIAALQLLLRHAGPAGASPAAARVPAPTSWLVAGDTCSGKRSASAGAIDAKTKRPDARAAGGGMADLVGRCRSRRGVTSSNRKAREPKAADRSVQYSCKVTQCRRTTASSELVAHSLTHSLICLHEGSVGGGKRAGKNQSIHKQRKVRIKLNSSR